MDTFLNITGQIFRGIFRIIEAIFSGIVSIISEYPKFSALVVAVAGFMYCLRYVPGFGKASAELIGTVLVFGFIIKALIPSKKKKKR